MTGARDTTAMQGQRLLSLAMAAGACAVLVPFPAAAEDVPKSGPACEACHGSQGNKPVTPDTPRLAGQHYDYLVQALGDYRKGARENPIMSAMAKPLTDKEIRELASYFSKQPGLTTKR